MNDTRVAQVGGKHYEGEVQHWDLMEKFDVGYLEGVGTKYLLRWRKKGTPGLDLGKAASYFEKLILCRPAQGTRRLVPQHELDAMYAATRTHYQDALLVNKVLASGSHQDIVEVLEIIRELIKDNP